MAIGALLQTLGGRALAPLGELGCDVLLERSLDDELPAVNPDVDVTLRFALPADIDEICRMYEPDPFLYIGDPSPSPGSFERARELYLDRLKRGELCFLATVEGVIAHVNWICFQWGEALPEHPIRLHAGEIYTTDALTPAAFRGRGLHPFVLRSMLAYARQRGFRHAYTLARIDRTGSLKGLYALGWKECGRVVYFLRRGRTKAWFVWRRGNVEPLFRPA